MCRKSSPRREGRDMWGYPYWVACILCRGFFSHRTHRFNRTFLHTVSNPQNASGIQISQNLSTHVSNNVLWYLSSACRRLCVLPVRRKASVPLWKSVRDRIPHEPRRMQKGFCSFVKLCERWNIQRALFKTKISVETNPTTTKESNTCKQGTRRALSWGKKGVFNTQGGYVLEWWRASSRNV